MKRIVYKLKFTTPLRFGKDRGSPGLAGSSPFCHADTFFSALCNEWALVYGSEAVAELSHAVEEGQLLLSNLFPYNGKELYLPKPILYYDKAHDEEILGDRKKLKKISHIPINRFTDYINFVKHGGEIDLEPINFIQESADTHVAIGRGGDSQPYVVSNYRYREGTGLYIIMDIDDEELENKINKIMSKSLGLSGIGGRRSSGLGKFELSEDSFEPPLYDSDKLLNNMMNSKADYYMSLSTIAPSEEDLKKINDEDYYTFIARKGFIYSPYYSGQPVKRKQTVMFAAGSCFKKKLSGKILDVSDGGNHPVYRYGKGMFVGVSL